MSVYEDKIKKAKKGNKKAFQDLMEEEKYKLFRIAYLYAKNENDALDIVQETIYKAYISISNLKEINYFSTWLSKILINTSIDFIRKDKKNIVVPIDKLEVNMIKNEPQIEDKLDLLKEIKKLDEPYKSVLILRYYRDLSVKQIAEILNCPEGTVKTNIHRAVNKLRLEITKECL